MKMIFLFCFIMYLFALATSNYNQSWIKNGNYEYYIAQEQVNYTTANLRCSELNAGLVMIFDQATQDFLQTRLKKMTDSETEISIRCNRRCNDRQILFLSVCVIQQ